MRTMLQRLECNFASQEAKLDRLLNLIATQQLQRPQHNSTTPTPDTRHTSSELPYTPPVPPLTSSLPDLERVLDDVICQSESFDATGMIPIFRVLWLVSRRLYILTFYADPDLNSICCCVACFSACMFTVDFLFRN